MDFILMDIKNFLKKLENGQLEIEAGQWELHKDITNMKKVVNELKYMKEELGKVRINSLQQMGLIKELQDRFDTFRTATGNYHMINESVAESEGAFKGQPDGDGADEEFNKINCHFDQSDEVLDITSRNSKVKSDICNDDSDLRIVGPRGVNKDIDEFERSCSETSGNLYSKKKAKSTSETDEDLPSPHYLASSTNQDILQRYLQDSAKYLGQQTPGSSEISFRPSDTTACENESPAKECHRSECEDCSSVVPADSDGDYQQPKVKPWKRRIARAVCSRQKPHVKCSHTIVERRHRRRQRLPIAVVNCKTCGKDFSSKNKLKKHEVVHWMSSTNSNGFKCSYCKKICPTPEELTQHLKKCRIITRSYDRMKNSQL